MADAFSIVYQLSLCVCGQVKSYSLLRLCKHEIRSLFLLQEILVWALYSDAVLFLHEVQELLSYGEYHIRPQLRRFIYVASKQLLSSSCRILGESTLKFVARL